MVSEKRYQAYLDAMKSHNLPVEEDMVAHGYYVADSAKYHVPNFLAAGATAILCGNDLIASGVITECRLRGFLFRMISVWLVLTTCRFLLS